ncbi:1-acyl-sn-glycerol-3-phosphate acyltransferase, partial [Gordonia crocea]|uniref:1-acyl-sn-glycerol-3-phosphate acyltransferase n=1 Tax=Gordonia crocea TaxID=589162 RepID=UPI0016431553
VPGHRPVYDKWFRVEVTGAENLPETGGALLVANHAGTIPIDALMTSIAVHDNHPSGRYLRLLAADMAFDSPVLARWPVASVQPCLLERRGVPAARRRTDRGVAGGLQGIGKLYKDRYKLQRFGRGGFVTTAIRTGAPIIPVSIVGSEEIYPMLGDLKPVAKVLGLPYFPVTPLFPWLVRSARFRFRRSGTSTSASRSPPTLRRRAAADDPLVVFDLTDHVREEIQQTLFRMLSRRGGVYLG